MMDAILIVFFVVVRSLFFGLVVSEFKCVWDELRADDALDAHEESPRI